MGLGYLKQEILDNMKRYKRYHRNLELGDKVGAEIHLIQAEERQGKGGFIGWQGYTRGREVIYRGFGQHREMLDPGIIEKNALIINKILRNREKRKK